MEKYATSEEQSKLLLEAGVKLETADMAWSLTLLSNGGMGRKLIGLGENESLSPSDIPAWSSYALMKVLPAEIRPKGIDEPYLINPFKYNVPGKGIEYGITYRKDYPPLQGDYIGYTTMSDKQCHDYVDCQVCLLLDVIKDGMLPDDEETKRNFIKKDKESIKSFIGEEMKKIYEPGMQQTVADCFGLQ
jgi:hypothetical protein